MQTVATSDMSRDLERIVCRVEGAQQLGADFCDRLTRSLTQLFQVAEASCSPEDRVSFDRILVRVAPVASEDARLALSDALADAAEPPRAILLKLANDVLEVARPILVRSPALADEDLAEIARINGSGHMIAIAGRPGLGYRVTDILVLRGDDDVRRAVAANPSAHLTDKSFSRLSLQARSDTLIEARLLRRDDLPEVVIRFLVDHGSVAAQAAQAERSRARARSGLGTCTVPIRAAEDGWLEPYDFTAAAAVLDRLPEVRNHVDGFVRRLAETDRFAEVVQILAGASDLPLDTMKHVMVSLDTEPFAVIARALALRSDTVSELLSTGPWLHRLDTRMREQTVTLFRALDPDDARARVHGWVEEAAGPRR